jgi:hypothetical protein
MLEMVVATAASAVLMVGLGSVMYIARQVAYAPTAAAQRAKTADIANQISDELRFATVITQNTSRILEFVVADRNSDGTAEKIRYEWSGTPGDPLRKTVNGGTPADVLSSVYAFNVTLQQKSKTTTLTTTNESAESLFMGNPTVVTGNYRDIDTNNFVGVQIVPAAIMNTPSNDISWNLSKVEFDGKQYGTATETLTVQLRTTGDSALLSPDAPTSSVLGQTTLPESSLTATDGFNAVTFPNGGVRNLSFNRFYQVVLMQQSGGGQAAKVTAYNSGAAADFETSDGGASWQYIAPRQLFGRIYGTFTTPGTSYTVTRNYVQYVRLGLQAGSQSHARIDSSIPLRNTPELLAGYWRTDFDRNPAATNINGDTSSDWAVTGGGAFDTTKLNGGVWTATGAIETRPLNNFTTTTTVEARCRNTSVGGNGAVMALYADRQNGTYGPILVYLQKQSDGSQTLTLNGRTSDTITKSLFSRTGLSGGFVRVRLTVVPASDLVNLTINDEDQGTFNYPRYAPTSASDAYLTVSTDTSSSEFDYVELRSGMN